MNYYLILAGALFVYINLWFVLSLIKKRNDVADVAWGLGFVLLSWTSFFLADNVDPRKLLVLALVSIWGFRLAWHIHSRNSGKGEDYRYLAWRQQWGKWFYARSYAQVFLLQGALLFIVALPILVINESSLQILNWRDIAGVAIWIFGFYFEVIGDRELARFMKDPSNKGKLLQSGLWSYSRHPNYFGEVTQWWGIWILSLSSSAGWLAIIGPLTISFLILKVSGVPMLEKKMAEHPEFAEYKRRVSMFIPFPPKNT